MNTNSLKQVLDKIVTGIEETVWYIASSIMLLIAWSAYITVVVWLAALSTNWSMYGFWAAGVITFLSLAIGLRLSILKLAGIRDQFASAPISIMASLFIASIFYMPEYSSFTIPVGMFLFGSLSLLSVIGVVFKKTSHALVLDQIEATET